MTRQLAIVSAVLPALLLSGPIHAASGAGAPQGITEGTFIALRTWIDAVQTHTPGRADASVVAMATLSYTTREDLNAGMDLFLAALVGDKYVTGGDKGRKAVAAMGLRAADPDAGSFLKKAAILHSDAAAYGDLVPVQSAGSAQPTPPRSRPLRFGAPIPPLLMNNWVTLNRDGLVLGNVVASWNWPFARSLLDLVPGDDPFVSAWYHATTAYMFAGGSYGEAGPHLQRAAEVLPDDAMMLFDRGCYAEILGLPMHQALLSEWASLRIPSAQKTNAEAERLFRRALAIEPALVEARVRLARLVELRGRHAEAAAELKTALAGSPSGVVAFYAHLFAGRSAQAMGQRDEASGHYQNAVALFPDAQSALLAASQLALLGSDVPATLAPVQRLGARSAAFMADPWWQYHLAAGWDMEDLLKALWASVPR